MDCFLETSECNCSYVQAVWTAFQTPIRDSEEGCRSPHMVIENPIPDDEIVRAERAPMVERANPAVNSNGSGQHITKDEDNGWVVPLDQLNKEERERPEMENTKL